MSLELPLYLYRNLNQAPGLALNAVASYTQGIGYLKTKTAHFLNTCNNQLQNTFNVVYPILRHPRSSTVSAVLFSTKYMANLTGMEYIYQKSCYLLSRRAEQIAFVENQLLVKLKKLSKYCKQLNTRHIPWQEIPKLQALETLKEELVNRLDNPSREKIAEAISYCDEIHTLVTLHRSISTEDLISEEIRAIEENTAIDTIFSAVEENMGEVLGSYTPSLLNAIPESYNPLALASSSLITSLKKILMIVGNSFALTVTSSNYFVSSNAQKTLLQLCSLSGISVIGLYYQEQIEETAKEVLKFFFEIIFAYAGMLLFKTDESFKDYFHKIIPAIAASKATEYYLDATENSTIISFALPLIVSSLVYNQASIRESCQRFKILTIHFVNGEAKRQLLQRVASLITAHVIHRISSGFTGLVLKRTIQQICPSELGVLAYAVLLMNSHISNQSLNTIFTPLFLPVINQLLAQPVEQQVLQALNFFFDKSLIKEYLTILQQDDMQELILRIQKKLSELDPEIEELKNQFLKEVFFKKTGIPLPLNNSTLDLLKKSFGADIQASLFISFKDAPLAIRMLWNSYSYHKKVDQTLTLELLLQGLIVTGLADLVPESNTAELLSFSYVKTAHLGINLVL
ncbi:hypothetical protein RHABOEDO_001092 [Candidatus Rhabdochlamydia oedothoracis]|uniref:Uncharacterized protein n=1 Tax=Candidatus Rhabdochlamydia oedothoracis TaxID=2720720 RepID=A0ABX8V5W8_9BACT|nr:MULTISPECIES: hypothetical protein [Rhabdochlamydia]KAG6559332.1 hypothetical protein RHOW815_000656 [Candidatus Rhabdochlamydia sp. W815]MCL6755724.1 hypothetical protein [Candidatus Rhabdochlamydia oedothoracis]QYF48860.1 hypothetical protein RHABOEDO_001092 [Candidatus Rhabdochlamydia oedothoracis]